MPLELFWVLRAFSYTLDHLLWCLELYKVVYNLSGKIKLGKKLSKGRNWQKRAQCINSMPGCVPVRGIRLIGALTVWPLAIRSRPHRRLEYDSSQVDVRGRLTCGPFSSRFLPFDSRQRSVKHQSTGVSSTIRCRFSGLLTFTPFLVSPKPLNMISTENSLHFGTIHSHLGKERINSNWT